MIEFRAHVEEQPVHSSSQDKVLSDHRKSSSVSEEDNQTKQILKGCQTLFILACACKEKTEKEKRITGRFGAHEKNGSQGPVGLENTQMTAKIGPLPDGIFILFTRHATSGGIMF